MCTNHHMTPCPRVVAGHPWPTFGLPSMAGPGKKPRSARRRRRAPQLRPPLRVGLRNSGRRYASASVTPGAATRRPPLLRAPLRVALRCDAPSRRSWVVCLAFVLLFRVFFGVAPLAGGFLPPAALRSFSAAARRAPLPCGAWRARPLAAGPSLRSGPAALRLRRPCGPACPVAPGRSSLPSAPSPRRRFASCFAPAARPVRSALARYRSLRVAGASMRRCGRPGAGPPGPRPAYRPRRLGFARSGHPALRSLGSVAPTGARRAPLRCRFAGRSLSLASHPSGYVAPASTPFVFQETGAAKSATVRNASHLRTSADFTALS